MAWRDHPLLGLGPDNFRRGYNRYLGLPDPDERLHANNLYFETLASLGHRGRCGAGAGHRRLRARRPRRAAAARHVVDRRPAALTGVAAGLAAYLVHGFFDYFLEFTPTYALLWFLGGLLAPFPATIPQRAPA